jgi:hypothetical protein
VIDEILKGIRIRHFSQTGKRFPSLAEAGRSYGYINYWRGARRLEEHDHFCLRYVQTPK